MGLPQLDVRNILRPSSFRFQTLAASGWWARSKSAGCLEDSRGDWPFCRSPCELMAASGQLFPPSRYTVALYLPIYLCFRNLDIKFSVLCFNFMSIFVAVLVQAISVLFPFWGSVIRVYLTLFSWDTRGFRSLARSTGRETLGSSLLRNPGSLPRSSSAAGGDWEAATSGLYLGLE